ncbi:MAG: hypothetical protein ACR2QR_05230 [Woeseiaceae bacterium]
MGAFFRWIGTTFGVLLLVGVVFGFLMDAGVVPSARVLTGPEIPEDHYQVLRAEGIVQEGEVVEYFYSEGLLSVREGGSVLTDQRVIAYEENFEDEIDLYQIYHEDIVSVEMTQEGGALNFAVYTVNGQQEEDWLDLWLPHEYGDAEKFAAAVRAKIR